jgi:hypothetical protein
VISQPQLPQAGEVSLDHVAWFAPETEAEGRAFERLGFVLTPYVQHRAATADGGLELSGTANRCAMLQRGYLEILSPVQGSGTALANQLRAGLARYPGVHLVAFGIADAEAERSRLFGEGFDPRPVVSLRRRVAVDGGGEADAEFSVVRTAPEVMPEGRIQFLVHQTPHLVWQPRYLAHENAIEALTGVLVAVADVAEAAGRYARFTGRRAEALGEGCAVIALDRGRIAFAPWNAARHDRRTAPAAPPFMAAVALQSSDLDATRSFMASRRVRLVTEGASYLVVHPDDAAGTALVIHAQGADDALYAR